MFRFASRLIFFLCLFFSAGLFAGELYVTQNLKVHTEASLESPVNHLLLGGQKVTVISIKGDFTEITDEVGHRGWVASEFLTDVVPDKITPAVKNIIKDKKGRKEKNKKTDSKKTDTSKEKKDKKSALNKKQATQAVETVTKQQVSIQELKQITQNNKQMILSEPLTTPVDLIAVKKQQILEQIEATIGQLEQQLDTLRDIKKTETGTSLLYELLEKHMHFVIGVVLLFLITGFILGLLWADYNSRRRHGGFKV